MKPVIVHERIGCIDVDEGTDTYYLIINREDDMTPDQACEWLLPIVYEHSRHPGAWFCTSVLAVQAPYSTNSVICIAQHRQDI